MNSDTRNLEQAGDERRSIRALRLTPLKDVEKDAEARRVRPAQPPLGYRDPSSERPLNIERRPRRRWGWIHTAFTVGSVVLLAALMYPILFPKATITVTPRSAILSFTDMTFTASKDGAAGVKYTLTPVVISETASVAAAQKKLVQAKAHGTITVQNTAQKASQRLIKNTRFESTAGKIYRIRESIVVPGFTEKDGKVIPGTLTVEVYADEEGLAYNLREGTLTVPGLKDKADLYAGITAKVSAPIAGGSSGTRFVITDMERQSVVKTMEAKLLSRARDAATAQLPTNAVAVTGGEDYTFRDLPDEEDGTNIIVGREITYNRMVFDGRELAEYFRTKSSQADLPDSPAHVTNIRDITLALEKDEATTSVFSEPSLSFTVLGSPTLMWEVDTEALAHALAGSSRENIDSILKKIPTIGAGTTVDIMPFWNNYVPSESRVFVRVAETATKK